MPHAAIDATDATDAYQAGRSYALDESRTSLPDVCPYDADPDMADAWWKGICDALAEQVVDY